MAPTCASTTPHVHTSTQAKHYIEILILWCIRCGTIFPSLKAKTPTKLSSRIEQCSAGNSGFTAYAGLYDVCKVKEGEKVFVSTASGSVGNLVGQLAKLNGCYVVGSTGSNSKVDILKKKLGFDGAFNYKEEPDLNSALRRYFPEGIDVYFDNVGGEMLEAAVANMNPFGRVAACGAISEYTGEGRRAAPNMTDVIYKRISIRGYLIPDYVGSHLQDEFLSTTVDHLRHGRIHVLEDVSRGVESIPSAFAGLFRGDNVGKKLVQVAEF